MGMVALGREDIENQNRIVEQGGVQPLVRLLRSHKTSERVLLTVIKVLGTLCLGLAHTSNKVTQNKIADEQAVPILVHLMVNPPSQEIQVEVSARQVQENFYASVHMYAVHGVMLQVAYTLGCIVLNNNETQEKLGCETSFKYDILLSLLATASNVRSAQALTRIVVASHRKMSLSVADDPTEGRIRSLDICI